MTNKQVLSQQYKEIEYERKLLKQNLMSLKSNMASSDKIHNVSQRLSKLTLSQINILIDIEWTK